MTPGPDFDATSVNREAWDRRTQLHLSSEFYDLAGFKSGRCSLNSIELELLGKVEARRVLHLQCHFGQDSLSLARLGAEVTGVDFSRAAVTAAKSLSEELSIRADFVCSDVLKLDLGVKFDTVFTSYGVLSWLESSEILLNPDMVVRLRRWRRMTKCLHPGMPIL